MSRAAKGAVRYFDAASGKHTNAAQSLEAALRKDDPQAYSTTPEGFVQQVAVPNRYLDFVRVVEKITGVKIVFVQGANGVRLDFDGAYVGGRTLYVNRGATRSVQFVVGHEFTHYLKQKFPKIYEDLEAALAKASNVKKAAGYASKGSSTPTGPSRRSARCLRARPTFCFKASKTRNHYSLTIFRMRSRDACDIRGNAATNSANWSSSQ